MNGTEFSLWGMGGAAAILVVLSFLKVVWLDASGEPVLRDRWAVLASVVLGLIAAFGVSLAQGATVTIMWGIETFGQGFLAGLAACGMFSAVKSRKE